jgi:hypothetical protein
MISPVSWMLPSVALAATVLAVVAGGNLSIALPAAAIAVLAAALLFARSWSRRARAPDPPPPPARTDTDRLRLAFHSGRLGREEVAVALNRLERSFLDPNLAPPPVDELSRVAALPPEQFRSYVARKLDRLEARP